MTISFFLTVLALSTPFPISYGATDEFHPPKSPFFAKLNPYLLFEDRMNLTEAQYKFGKYFRFEDPFDGPYNYGKGFWRGVSAPLVSWAKHNKFVQDEEAEAHHVKKRSPFLPNVPNPLDGIFRPISGLFQRGGGDWRPNIPYVIFSRGQPGFDRTGAVQQVSRPLRNPVFYENGVGGVRARPARPSNPRGLRPIDFNINESQLRGRSGGFK